MCILNHLPEILVYLSLSSYHVASVTVFICFLEVQLMDQKHWKLMSPNGGKVRGPTVWQSWAYVYYWRVVWSNGNYWGIMREWEWGEEESHAKRHYSRCGIESFSYSEGKGYSKSRRVPNCGNNTQTVVLVRCVRISVRCYAVSPTDFSTVTSSRSVTIELELT